MVLYIFSYNIFAAILCPNENVTPPPGVDVFIFANDGEFRYGDSVVYTCNQPGYVITGTDVQVSVTCTASGTWDKQLPVVCKRMTVIVMSNSMSHWCGTLYLTYILGIECEDPGPGVGVTKRQVIQVNSTLGFLLGDTITYTCLLNYHYRHRETWTVECTASGQFSGDQPVCEGLTICDLIGQ